MSDEQNRSRIVIILLGLMGAVTGSLLFFWRRRPESPAHPALPEQQPIPIAETTTIPAIQAATEPTTHLTDTHRLWLARGLGLIALLCMIYSSLGLGWSYGVPIPQYVEPVAVLGLILFGVAIWLSKLQIQYLRPTKAKEKSRRLDHREPKDLVGKLYLRPFAGGVLLMILSAEANIGRIPLLPTSMHVQVAFFVAGILLMIYGLGGVPRNFLPPKRIRWRVLLPILLITLIGFIVRVWDMEQQIRFLVDELLFTDPLVIFRVDSNIPIFMPMHPAAAFTRLHLYMEQPFVGLFGYTLTSARLLSVVIGTLTIPATYFLAHRLFDRKTALIAALLIATYPPHIHFSRLALNNITDPLFGVLAMGFLAQGLRRNHRSDYVLAGVMLGLSHYFYEGGRLLFTGVVMFWLAIVIIGWRPWQHWRGILLFLVAFLLVILPLYYVWGYYDLSFTSRLDNMGGRQILFSTKTLGDALSTYWQSGVRPALLHIFYTPDGTQFYYGGNTGLVLWFILPALLLGVAWCLHQLSMAGRLLIVWVLAMIVGNSLLFRSDWTTRFVVGFPALVLLVAVGIRYTVHFVWLIRYFPRIKRGVLIVLVCTVCATQTLYYHTVHIPYYNDQFRSNEEGYDAMLRATEYPDGSYIYVITYSEFFWHMTNMFAFWDRHFEVFNITPDELTGDFIRDMPRDKTLLFFTNPMDSATRAILEAHFTLEGPYWSDNPYIRFEEQYRLFVVQPSE